jgi:cytoskeleton bundling-enhancing protein CbeA-like protein
MSNPTRGLQREITLRLGARLVQEGNRLHYLADRASITGKFSDIECRKLDETFPHFIRQMESMLTTGELSPTMPTASPCTTTVSPAKPTPSAPAVTFIWLFIRRPKRKSKSSE